MILSLAFASPVVTTPFWRSMADQQYCRTLKTHDIATFVEAHLSTNHSDADVGRLIIQRTQGVYVGTPGPEMSATAGP
jgi:hypothetical protein